MDPSPMSAFLTDIGTFFTESLTWVTTILTEVTDSPALTVLVLGFPVVGFAFGLLNRLIKM